jgi:hypothetical protein
VGALKNLAEGLALLRAVAQSDAVKELKSRLVEGVGERAARLAQSELSPRAVAVPARILAVLLGHESRVDARPTDAHVSPDSFEEPAPADTERPAPTEPAAAPPDADAPSREEPERTEPRRARAASPAPRKRPRRAATSAPASGKTPGDPGPRTQGAARKPKAAAAVEPVPPDAGSQPSPARKKRGTRPNGTGPAKAP